MYLLKKILSLPLFWIGILLTCFTIHYEGQKEAFAVFFIPETYRNLLVGGAIYVALFDRRYTEHRERFDIKETFKALIETVSVIFFVWSISLVFYVGYHEGGEAYSLGLRKNYARIQAERNR